MNLSDSQILPEKIIRSPCKMIHLHETPLVLNGEVGSLNQKLTQSCEYVVFMTG